MLISAKFYERNEILIYSFDLQREMGTRYSEKEIIDYEKKILMLLNWNISFTTIIHYVQFFYSTGIAFKSDQVINKQNKRIFIEEVGDLSSLTENFIK